jgi:hypothetical protein
VLRNQGLSNAQAFGVTHTLQSHVQNVEIAGFNLSEEIFKFLSADNSERATHVSEVANPALGLPLKR